jgi:tetratricopeptide (TPR) repeat protein
MRLAIIAAALFLIPSALPQTSDAQSKKDLALLSQLGKKRDMAKAFLKQHPKDAQAKKRFLQANDKFAYETMNTDALSPKKKYPQALKLYRESLKTDPNDAEAGKWVQMIESIYRSMKRPIPK